MNVRLLAVLLDFGGFVKFVRIVLVAACLAAIVRPGTSVAITDPDTLGKHRTFAGWTAGDATFKSWRFTAKASSTMKRTDPRAEAQQVGVKVTEIRRGALYHDREARDGTTLTTESGFTGRVFWDTNENGFVVTHYEDQARADVSINTIMDDAISTYPATSRGTAKIGDQQYEVLRVSPNQGFPVDLYLDSSGAYRRAIISPDDRWHRITLNIEKYIDGLPGKKVIGKFRFGSGSAYEVTNFEANVPVSDDDLVPPQPGATWTFGSPQTIPITVVLHTGVYGSTGRAVQFRASINGHEGTFLLDSGASGILLFNPFAESLKLPKIAPYSFGGVNGNSEDADNVKVDALAVGGSVLHNVVVLVPTGRGFGDIDGIIGYDFLANAIVDVDIAGKTLTVRDPDKYTPTVAQGATAFTVDLGSRQPSMHITVANGVDAKPIFDTGDDFNVILSEELRKNGQVNPDVSGLPKYFGGVDGTATAPVPCGKLQRILVGPYRYENSSVCFIGWPPSDGLVGFDFLRHFNWTFDYPDGKLILTPNGLN